MPTGLSLTLRHLTLANGLQSGNYIYFGQTFPVRVTAGRFSRQGNLDIENCTFANNSVISQTV